MKLKAALAGAILSLAFAAGTAHAAPVVNADAVRSVAAADASVSPVTQVHYRHRHRRWHRHRWHRHRWHRHRHYGRRHCRWRRKCGYYGCRVVRRCHRHW